MTTEADGPISIASIPALKDHGAVVGIKLDGTVTVMLSPAVTPVRLAVALHQIADALVVDKRIDHWGL